MKKNTVQSHADTLKPAGYSGTPLPVKLGIKPGSRVALLNLPVSLQTLLTLNSDEVVVRQSLIGKALFDVIVLFVNSRSMLEKEFSRAAASLHVAGGLWVAWPKKASGIVTDISDNVLREVCLPSGMVDNKVCAIDQTWSGLRFVRRLKDRPS